MESPYHNDIWNEGEPPSEGWYDCLKDGEELRLQWWICKVNHKKRHWKNEQGGYEDVVGGKIYWTGQPSASIWG